MKARFSAARYSMIALVILALPGLMTGCASEVSAPAAFQNAERIDFDDAAGRTALRLEPDGDSIRVEGPRGALIATVREKSGELVVENAAGEATWLIDESDDDRLLLRVRAASSDRVRRLPGFDCGRARYPYAMPPGSPISPRATPSRREPRRFSRSNRCPSRSPRGWESPRHSGHAAPPPAKATRLRSNPALVPARSGRRGSLPGRAATPRFVYPRGLCRSPARSRVNGSPQ